MKWTPGHRPWLGWFGLCGPGEPGRSFSGSDPRAASEHLSLACLACHPEKHLKNKEGSPDSPTLRSSDPAPALGCVILGVSPFPRKESCSSPRLCKKSWRCPEGSMLTTRHHGPESMLAGGPGGRCWVLRAPPALAHPPPCCSAQTPHPVTGPFLQQRDLPCPFASQIAPLGPDARFVASPGQGPCGASLRRCAGPQELGCSCCWVQRDMSRTWSLLKTWLLLPSRWTES